MSSMFFFFSSRRRHTRSTRDWSSDVCSSDLGHEVTHELLLRVAARVDLRDGSELGVRTEDEVDGGGGPLDLARAAIPTLEQVLSRGGCLPLRAHIEQVDEEVVGQCFGPVGED